jgi:hypothetical protein
MEPSQSEHYPVNLASDAVRPTTELFFHDLPHGERLRLLEDVDLEIKLLTQSDVSRLSFVLARFSLTIFVPLILSLFVLLQSQRSAPLPAFFGSSAADCNLVVQPPIDERVGPNERKEKYDNAQVELQSWLSSQERERQILITRHKFQFLLLLFAFCVVTVVFLVGQQFLSDAQSDLTMLWCEIREKNEPVAEDDL